MIFITLNKFKIYYNDLEEKYLKQTSAQQTICTMHYLRIIINIKSKDNKIKNNFNIQSIYYATFVYNSPAVVNEMIVRR